MFSRRFKDWSFDFPATAIVEREGEQKVLSVARKMSTNLSYRKVWEFLTSVGVPTKSQRRGWQPEMVRSLLICSHSQRQEGKIIMQIQQVIARESYAKVLQESEVLIWKSH